jgi:Ca-activated chloride channel family protein
MSSGGTCVAVAERTRLAPTSVRTPQAPPQTSPHPVVKTAAERWAQTFLPPGTGLPEMSVIIIDVSGSMHESYKNGMSKLDAAKDAVCALCAQKARVDRNDCVAAVKFSDDAECVLPMMPVGSGGGQIVAAVRGLDTGGGTNLNAALVLARDQVFEWNRDDVVRRIVVLSDGHSHSSPLRTSTELKSRGVVIDTVGVGPTPDSVDPVLQQICSVIGGQVRYRFIDSPATLTQHYTMLGNKTRVA